MDLTQFLLWVAINGGNISICSWACERWAWFQKQTSEMKQYIFFGIAFVVASIGYAVMTFVPADILSMIAPFFAIAYATFTTVFMGNAFHKLVNKQ